MWYTIFLEGLNRIELAKAIAEKQHAGQVRKGSGEPYVNHPKRVSDIIRRFKGNSHEIESLRITALLHDTVEDGNLTIADIHSIFGVLVASLVQELTSDKKQVIKMGKKKYLAKKMCDMTSWGLVLKLADRYDNTSDLMEMKPSFRRKYVNETLYILKELDRNVKLTSTQKKLIRAIERNLAQTLYEI